MVIQRKSNTQQAILIIDKDTALFSSTGGVSTTSDNHVSVSDKVWNAVVKELGSSLTKVD